MSRIRRDIATLTLGDEEAARSAEWHPVLATYARGVELMQALPEDDPRSWLWAANTHGIPPGTPARPGWRQCAHASLFFLPWHRAYLAWFESTVRTLTGDGGWALPYWDYSRPDTPEPGALPVELTVPTRTVDGQAVANALFDETRGTAPIPAEDADVVRALSEPRYVGAFPNVGFGGSDQERAFGDVESLPHNFVHVDLGGLMESPTTAGRDPIFWLHHCNVDRLWEVWRGLDGSVALTDPGATSALVVSQWDSAVFWFGQERSPSTYTMADVEELTSTAMDYGYDTLELPPAIADAVAAGREAASTGGALTLDGSEPRFEPVAAEFDVVSGEERELVFRSGQRSLDVAAPQRLLLSLGGVRATAPHAVYVVEVRSSPDAEPHQAGRFATFGLAGTPEEEDRSFVVDATAVLPDLLAEGWTGGSLSVRVVPQPGRPDAGDEQRGIRIEQVTVYTAPR